jgi:hypothetical protein
MIIEILSYFFSGMGFSFPNPNSNLNPDPNPSPRTDPNPNCILYFIGKSNPELVVQQRPLIVDANPNPNPNSNPKPNLFSSSYR